FQPRGVAGLLAALREVAVDAPRQLVGTHRRNADGHEHTRHQALGERLLGTAERQRLSVAAVIHARAPAGNSSASCASSSSETTSLTARTISTPRSAASSATTSIAAAFSSTRYTSASIRSRSARRRERSARLRE